MEERKESLKANFAKSPVNAYIEGKDEKLRPDLELVRNTLKTALPDAVETISWGMPAYRKEHNIICFSAARNHIGLYPGPEAVKHFAQELKEKRYSCSKGSIRIPYGKADADLIGRIAAWNLQTGNHA